jgi:BirA family biotin operon repressor/biotin-[acetyl-CoA-carboxylase] ligase
MIIGSSLIFIKDLPSTNTYAATLLKTSNPPDGTVIHTNFQLAGRGQKGNKWESEDGNNLLLSIILYPSFVEPTSQFIISMALSLGIFDFLVQYNSECRIKWPNDIYVNDDKIAGLLIENSVMGNNIENTIAGIGLNINQTKFFSDAPNPVSLSMVTGKKYDLVTCLGQLTSFLDKRYDQLVKGNNSQIKEEYISKLYKSNVWSGFRDKNGSFSGRIKSVSDIGRIQIETKSGVIKEYSFKEVEFIR